MLALVEGCPEVTAKVWEGIMDRLIRLDVRVFMKIRVLEITLAEYVPTGRDSNRVGGP